MGQLKFRESDLPNVTQLISGKTRNLKSDGSDSHSLIVWLNDTCQPLKIYVSTRPLGPALCLLLVDDEVFVDCYMTHPRKQPEE